MPVVVLLLPLSLAMDDSEFDNSGGSGGRGGLVAVAVVAGGRAGEVVTGAFNDSSGGGRLMAVAAWQHSTAAIDYGKVMAGGTLHSTVVVVGGDGD